MTLTPHQFRSICRFRKAWRSAAVNPDRLLTAADARTASIEPASTLDPCQLAPGAVRADF